MQHNYTATKTRQYKSIVLLLLVLNLFINGVQASVVKEFSTTADTSVSTALPVFTDYHPTAISVATSAKVFHKQGLTHFIFLNEEFTTRLRVAAYNNEYYSALIFSFTSSDIIYPFHWFW